MSRYDTPAVSPVPSTREGDNGFSALNLKFPREQLPPGTLARAENKRFNRGAETRRGTRTPTWANMVTPRTTQLKGSGLYSDPNGSEMLLLANQDAIYGVRAGCAPVSIALPETLAEAVEFTQHFDKVLLHRDDPTKTTLIWDGASPAVGFVPLDATPIGNGIEQIPNAPWSVDFLGRNWFPVPGSPDQIGASDVPSSNGPGYDTWDSDLHSFRINLGTADSIVGLYPYPGSNLIVGKRRSIDVFANIPDDLGDSFVIAQTLGLAPASAPKPRVLVVSTSIGMSARKCCVMVGSDLLFLSDAGEGGIYRLTPAGTLLEVDPNPVSDPILPLIQRINWDQADRSVAALDGIYACFAVPIDGSVSPNCVLVLNTATSQWQGVDLWPPGAMQISNLVVFDYFGTARLFSVDHPDVLVRLMYEGTDDQLQPSPDTASTFPIADLIETRGYNTVGPEGATNRDILRLEIMLETLLPSIAVTALLDGADERVLTRSGPVTYDRLTYTNWGAPAFRPSNVNNDFTAPRRRDYAAKVGDLLKLQSGIPLAQLAPSVLRYSLMARGRFVSFRIATDTTTGYTGMCNVLGLLEESAGKRKARRG